MIFSMEVLKEESNVTVEPQFLSQALASGIKLHIGQMNTTEFDGIIHEIGRYEINLDAGGKIVTLLKQEISYLTAPQVLLAFSAPQVIPVVSDHAQLPEAASGRPNIQQEFLDKAIKENQVLTLYLINGQRIKGNIEAYDSFTILLKEGGKQHLFYKHSITTINR
jgi:host factor-I protein